MEKEKKAEFVVFSILEVLEIDGVLKKGSLDKVKRGLRGTDVMPSEDWEKAIDHLNELYSQSDLDEDVMYEKCKSLLRSRKLIGLLD